jgi:hypothetical protein
MGYFRFQRRLKLFPGGWINLSKRAVRSRSVSKRGVTGTAGLPGSARHGFWQQLRAIFFP